MRTKPRSASKQNAPALKTTNTSTEAGPASLKDRSEAANRRWFRRIPWLTWIGPSLVFFSWVAQYYFDAKWSEEKAFHIQTQRAIQIEEGLLGPWLIAFEQESAKEHPHHRMLGLYAFKIVEYRANLLGWSWVRAIDENAPKAKVLRQKQDYIQNAAESLKNGDIDHVLKIAHDLSQVDENLRDTLMEEWGRRYDRVVVVEKRWNLAFVGAYVFGGLLIGAIFLRDKLTVR